MVASYRHILARELHEGPSPSETLLEALADRELSPGTRMVLLGEALACLVPEAATLPISAWAAQVLAELVNWAAKAHDELWYAAKPAAWALARELGAAGGWGDDEYGSPVYYLHTPEAGVSCAHDPGGELEELVPPETWPHPWSGIPRQGDAPRIAADARFRRMMAWATHPTRPHPSAVRFVLQGQKALHEPGEQW